MVLASMDDCEVGIRVIAVLPVKLCVARDEWQNKSSKMLRTTEDSAEMDGEKTVSVLQKVNYLR